MREFAEQAHGIEQWQTAIESNPDVTWRIMSDIVKVVQAESAPKRTGRRPAPEAMGFEQLLGIIYPDRFSMEPFPDALSHLMGDKTQVEFAPLMHVSQPQLSRLLKGKVTPDMGVMESAAAAGGVTPAFFVEWRAQKLASLVTAVYVANPNLSVNVVKQIARSTKVEA